MIHWNDDSLETVLIGTPSVRVRGYECRGEDFGRPRESRAPWHGVLFVRSGQFEKRLVGQAIVADPNWAVFFNDAEEYTIHASSPFDDAVTEVQIHPVVLAEMVASEGGSDDPLERPFLQPNCLISASLYRRQLQLWADARRPERFDPLDIEERALDIAGATIRTALARASQRPRKRRNNTAAAHADLACAVMQVLNRRYDERWTIGLIANEVASSPFHLCRVFRAETGLSIHRYIERLRLRAAFARLQDRPDSLTRLALDLGFSSHSHFTSVFRREFGLTPSAASCTA